MIKNYYNIIRGTAKAIFKLANTLNKTDEYLMILEKLSDLLQLRKIRDIVKSNLYPSSSKVDLLLTVIQSIPGSRSAHVSNMSQSLVVDDWFSNLIKRLGKKNLLLLMSKIFNAYQQIYLVNSNILKVELTTAIALAAPQQQYFKEILSKYFNKNILLSYNIDKNIIAGLILKYNDKVIDYSIKNKLQQMKVWLQCCN